MLTKMLIESLLFWAGGVAGGGGTPEKGLITRDPKVPG